jgi:hypothetical protein
VWSAVINVSEKRITFFLRTEMSETRKGKMGRKTSHGRGSDTSSQGGRKSLAAM